MICESVQRVANIVALSLIIFLCFHCGCIFGQENITAFQPNERDIYAITSKGVFLSKDDGSSWTQVQIDVPGNFDEKTLTTNGKFWFVKTKGNFPDWASAPVNAVEWKELGTYASESTKELLLNGDLVFRQQSEGYSMSLNGGAIWRKKKGDFEYVTCLAASSNFTVFGTSVNGIIYSAMYDEKWKKVTKGLPRKADYYPKIKAVAFHKSDYLVGTEGPSVFISTDGGTSLKQIFSESLDDIVTAIASNGKDIFIGTEKSGMYVSLDNGVTWTKSGSGLPTKKINCLIIAGNSVLAGTDQGIFKSSDNGKTWGLPKHPYVEKMERNLAATPLYQAEYTGPRTQEGHNGDINLIKMSKNGNYLVSAALKEGLILWDANNGRRLKSFWIKPESTFAIDINDAGTLIAAGNQGKIMLWGVNSGELITELETNQKSVTQVMFAGDYLYSCNWDERQITQWDLKTGKAVKKISGYLNFHITPDAKLRYGHDLLEIETGKIVRQYNNGPKGRTVFVTADNKLLFRADSDTDQAAVWNTESTEPKYVLKIENLRNADLSENGKILAATTGQAVRIYNADNGAETRTFAVKNCIQLELTPDGKYVIVESDRTIYMYDVNTGIEVRKFGSAVEETVAEVEQEQVDTKPEDAQIVLPNGYSQSADIVELSFTPDGKYLMSGSSGGKYIFWDIRIGKELNRISAGDGLLLGNKSFVGTRGKLVNVYDLASSRTIKEFTGHAKPVQCIAMSSDQRLLFAAGTDMSIVWDVNTGKELVRYELDKSELITARFSYDDKHIQLVYWTDNGKEYFDVFEAASGKKVNDFSAIDFRSEIHERIFTSEKVYSMNNQVYALFANADTRKAVQVFNRNGNFIRSFEAALDKSKIVSFALSADGKYIAISDSEARIGIFDIRSKALVREFKSSIVFPGGLALSNDGRYLVVASEDLKARTWDLTLGTTTRIYKRPWGALPIDDVIISPNNKYLITAGTGATLWDFVSGEEIERLSEDGKINASAVDFSSDGKYLLYPSFEKLNYGKTTIPEIYDLVSHKRKRPFLNPESKQLLMTQGHFNEEGTIVTAQLKAGNVYHTVKIDVKNNKVIEDNRALSELDYRSGVLSGDRKMSAVDRSVDVNGVSAWQLEVWNTESKTLIAKMPAIKGYQPVLSKAFSHDNKFLVGGCKDYTVKVWDTSNGKLVHSFTGHASWVESVIFSKDDSKIFSASSDGSIKVWETKTGKEIATLVTLGDKEFLIKTPDNYFYASKEAYKQIGFRMNNRVFPFEQFDLRLNRPDIVLDRLGTASPQLIGTFKNAYLKRLKKLRFTEEMLGEDYHVPEAYVVGKEVPYSSSVRELLFTVQGKDSLYNLERLNVYVNEVPIYGMKGISLREKKVKQYQHDVALTLSNGDNKIQYSFMNEKGAESIRETFIVNYSGAEANPDLYVVSIGISDYANNDMDLKYASKDAKDLAKMYQDKLKGPHRYNTIKTLTILDKEATRENILKCKDFLANSKVDDEVIIFIAGHGLLDEKLDYYLATTDVNFENPAEGGLLYEDFEGILDRVPSRHRLIMIDACHSGEVDKEEVVVESSTKVLEGAVASRGFKNVKKTEAVGLEGSFELMQSVFADLSKGSGAIVISSASGVEFAFESPEWKNGVFTYAVLEGLKTKKADANGNSEIKVSELRDYVVQRVTELTNGKQHPTSRKENLEFDFKVW